MVGPVDVSVRLAIGSVVVPSTITLLDASRDTVLLPMVIASLGRMVLEPITSIEESSSRPVMLPASVTVSVVLAGADPVGLTAAEDELVTT